MRRVTPKVLGYMLPILTTVVLAILLSIALVRLTNIQHEMRNNTHANPTWVIYQAHLESITLGRMLERLDPDEELESQIQFRYQLLLSRLKLLSEGLQQQALRSIDGYQDVVAKTQALSTYGESLKHKVDEHIRQHILDQLNTFDAMLLRIAGRTMAAQWEALGEQLDRYRDGVLLIFFLMVGVWVCGACIAIQLLYSLKKTREVEQAKRREVELNKQLEHERKVSSLYRSFGEMVSHQFRNPIAVIDASMQRLIRAGSRMTMEEIEGRAEKVRIATQRLTDLIDAILNADRFLHKVKANIQTCILQDLVRQVVAEQYLLTPLRRIYVVDDSDEGVLVRCDPVLTIQIIANLLNNAVKYSDEHTQITILLRHDGNRAYCLICDQGRGIADSELPHVFERYFRTRDASSVVGTGIGLHIASELAVLQDGEVQAYSELGQGSVFTLILQACNPTDG